MAKNLKLNIKNTQIAEAINLGSLKSKIAKKKSENASKESSSKSSVKPSKGEGEDSSKESKEEAPRVKARSRSAFDNAMSTEPQAAQDELSSIEGETFSHDEMKHTQAKNKARNKEVEQSTSDEEIFPDLSGFIESESEQAIEMPVLHHELEVEHFKIKQESAANMPEGNIHEPRVVGAEKQTEKSSAPPQTVAKEGPKLPNVQAQNAAVQDMQAPPRVKLGPTGRHINDLLPKKKEVETTQAPKALEKGKPANEIEDLQKGKIKPKGKVGEDLSPKQVLEDEEAGKKGQKAAKLKEFRDIKPSKRTGGVRSFDGRDRQGLRDTEEDQFWRKKRPNKSLRYQPEDITIRPTSLKIRIPIMIKDLASEMKLKASELISKLFLQGIVLTLNDYLDDATTIQLLGQDFGCEITIDTSEEQRIRITDQTIKEEVGNSDNNELTMRPPVVAFMGHVDHGKTSLIDAIRKSNRAAGEAGAITQHIGAFRCHTAVGDIAILDTPGHEAFSAMRARGADVTDIVVLVVAGDEGIKQQTVEAIQHAKLAKVTIVVAINKCDKPNFNQETVYRQLAELELLPESWGGQTITVNCSAVTGQGIDTLLEMLALQAEVLELKANPFARARGTVLESEMHKGLGAVATVLVQNGTLRIGDSLVFGHLWGRVKTMHDEYGRELKDALPSTPVEITGLSGLPEAGQEFIVVKNEREAREIAEARTQGIRQTNLLQIKKPTMENLFQQASQVSKKILTVVLRADVQGSLEALKAALQKIESTKAELNIIFAGVGEVSESDVQLAATSKALLLGFHTQIESHAEALVKQLGVQVKLHDIIYHAVDDVKSHMASLLDKIPQENDKGKAEVKATFKSSQIGIIAGCQVIEGTIHRNHHIRVKRDKEVVWKGAIASLKRVKEDVKEVQKGFECGILLTNFADIKEGDIIESYDITYLTQEL